MTSLSAMRCQRREVCSSSFTTTKSRDHLVLLAKRGRTNRKLSRGTNVVVAAKSRSSSSTSSSTSSSSKGTSHGPDREHVKAEAATYQPTLLNNDKEEGVSEKMARMKERALALWQSVDVQDDDKEKTRIRRDAAEQQAKREAQQKVLLEARLEFMEERIVAQAEYIKELNGALSVAKQALNSAMKCLETPLEEVMETKLPSLSTPSNNKDTEGEGASSSKTQEEADEECDVESFSNIEKAIKKADLLLEKSV